jgi:hypothetical protein
MAFSVQKVPEYTMWMFEGDHRFLIGRPRPQCPPLRTRQKPSTREPDIRDRGNLASGSLEKTGDLGIEFGDWSKTRHNDDR